MWPAVISDAGIAIHNRRPPKNCFGGATCCACATFFCDILLGAAFCTIMGTSDAKIKTDYGFCLWRRLLAAHLNSIPSVARCLTVIDFLGYDPFPQPQTFSEKMIAYRRRKGLRVRDVAALAGVDPCSWSSWEREEHRITATYHRRILALIAK